MSEEDERKRRAFAADKKRREEVAEMTAINQRNLAPAVKRRNEEGRQPLRELSDIALEAEIGRVEELVLTRERKVEYHEFREASADWQRLLNERAARGEERRQVAAKVVTAQERKPEERPYKGVNDGELRQTIDDLRERRDQLRREMIWDGSLRHSVSVANAALSDAMREREIRTNGLDRPRTRRFRLRDEWNAKDRGKSRKRDGGVER